MSPTELPPQASRQEMRKTLIRLRMEMHRQELRHETLVITQPLRQMQHLRRHWRDELGNSNAPLWITGGAVALAALGMRNGHLRRWIRIALVVFPLLRRHPPRGPATDANTAGPPENG